MCLKVEIEVVLLFVYLKKKSSWKAEKKKKKWKEQCLSLVLLWFTQWLGP